MPLSEAKKASRRRYQLRNFKNPIPRRRGLKSIDESVIERLDKVLLTTEVPVKAVAARFGLCLSQVKVRLKELGYRSGRPDVDTGTQERIPL